MPARTRIADSTLARPDKPHDSSTGNAAGIAERVLRYTPLAILEPTLPVIGQALLVNRTASGGAHYMELYAYRTGGVVGSRQQRSELHGA